MITLKNINKIYGDHESRVHAVKNADFTIDKGEYIKILGPSGSGKSTLLNMLAGLLHPTSGEIIVDGISLYNELDMDGLARFRSEYLGFIFQAFNLLPYMSALENVMLPLTPLELSKKEKVQKAEAALAKVGLADRLHHPPGKLSGGQQQRVAIARALVNDPLILFADEPTGNLDTETRSEILNIFADLNKQGHTILMVTHDESSLGSDDSVISIKDGIVADRQVSRQ